MGLFFFSERFFFFLRQETFARRHLSPLSFSRSSFLLPLSHLSHIQAATTDLDALEKCVSSVAYGDLDAEPRGKLSEVSCKKRERRRESGFSLVRRSKVSSAFFSLSLSLFHHTST